VPDRRGTLRGLLAFDVIPETLDKTNLGMLGAGDMVHVERSLRVGDRIDGHFVQGHVDGLALLLEQTGGSDDECACAASPAQLAKYVVPKGSVCLDGVSLTVASVEGHQFEVALIPTTVQRHAASRQEKKAGRSILRPTCSARPSFLSLNGAGFDGTLPMNISGLASETRRVMDYRPTIAITHGRPAGIGPEVIVKALADPCCGTRPVHHLRDERAARLRGGPGGVRRLLVARPVQRPAARYPHDVVVVDYDQYSMLGHAVRAPSKMGGEASMRFCLDAIDAAQRKISRRRRHRSRSPRKAATAGLSLPRATRSCSRSAPAALAVRDDVRRAGR
jgi:hypothetical protein